MARKDAKPKFPFLFETKDGACCVRYYSFFGCPERVKLDGKWAYNKGQVTGDWSWKPGIVEKWRRGVVNDASGVHPKDRKRAMAFCEAAGVPTYYNENGDPVFFSRRQRAEHGRKVTGNYDINAGYSDYAGGDHKLEVNPADYAWMV
jgi:hypothetical protein